MRAIDLFRLLLLAAIWGGSFVFLRVLAPALGPIVTAGLRVLIASLALGVYFRVRGLEMQWRRFWRRYLIIGALNAALPFCLFAFAALHIPASYSAILNATSPLFGALFSLFWLGERMTAPKSLGFVLGMAGVGLVTQVGVDKRDAMAARAMMACLLAALSYGCASVYTKRYAAGAPPSVIAGASQMMAGLLLLPFIPLAPPPGSITAPVVIDMIVFALLCSAVAFVLYFRLIANVGPTKSLTVTFLMPIFTMIWAAIFLGEAVTASMILGCALIIGGTGLVVVRRS